MSDLVRGTLNPPPVAGVMCANQHGTGAHHSVIFACGNPGSRSCSGCKLVKYCSTECQKAHWTKGHKRDCKNKLNSEAWRPDWLRERRNPTFIDPGAGPLAGWAANAQFGRGMHLWGNIPALDVLNLSRNEGVDAAKDQDFAIAFAACGDLRSTIRTINELPSDYSGSISVLLNDRDPYIMARNLTIILILTILDQDQVSTELACEYALHVWYSTFLPQSYLDVKKSLLSRLNAISNAPTMPATLSSTSTLLTDLSRNTWTLLFSTLSKLYDPSDASKAFNGVMNTPVRVDYVHRFYAHLKPGHRAAFQKWRTTGIVLPHGELDNHFKGVPNAWLFSQDANGQLEFNLDDSANPLRGWNIGDILEAGKAQSAPEYDIIGATFFYIKDQLMEFASRLRKFKVKFFLADKDALQLPCSLASIPSAPRTFDRIEVSNITDSNYCKVAPVLSTFGPVLNSSNPHATLIALFMNWITDQHAGSLMFGSPDNPNFSVASARMKQQLPEYSRKLALDAASDSQSLGCNPQMHPNMLNMFRNVDAFNESSKHFLQYLSNFEAPQAARRAGLKMRLVNTIAPPRLHVPLGSRHNAILQVKNEDEWYQIACLENLTYAERYVEWKKAT